MAKFLNAHGTEVSAADAKIGGKLRPGFKEMLSPGEHVSFDMNFVDSALKRDAKPEPDQASIDELVKERIASLAKQRELTPSEWLGQADLREVEQLAVDAVQEFLRKAIAKGVTASLSFDGRTAHKGLTMARDSINRLINARLRDGVGRARKQRFANPGANMVEPQASVDAMRRARFR